MTSLDLRQMRSISYWQQSVGLPGHDPASPPPHHLETELCIVGGGITGSSAALFATQQGMKVCLVEARKPGLGASGRNAGMVLTGVADSYASAVQKYGRAQARDLWQLSITNRETTLRLADALGVPYQRCGSWLLADSEEEVEQLARSTRLLTEDGFVHEYSDRDPLQRGFLAGLFRPQDAVLNPAQLVRAIQRKAAIQVIPHTTVTALDAMPDGRVAVVAANTTIVAERVLLNTNAYSSLLHPFFTDKVIPCRGQIQVSQPAPLVFPSAGYSHFGYWYFRQIPDPATPGLGRWLIGGGRHLHRASENGIFDEGPSAAVQADLAAYTARYFPELAAVPIEHRWAGTMGFTADGLPLVGRLPDLPQVYFCVGFNGHGMGLGMMAARQALDLLTIGKAPSLFGVERLAS